MNFDIFVDKKNRHITVDWENWDEFVEMAEWCEERGFEVYATGMLYPTDEDLTAFMLRWR
jgi:hypothetical protein